MIKMTTNAGFNEHDVIAEFRKSAWPLGQPRPVDAIKSFETDLDNNIEKVKDWDGKRKVRNAWFTIDGDLLVLTLPREIAFFGSSRWWSTDVEDIKNKLTYLKHFTRTNDDFRSNIIAAYKKPLPDTPKAERKPRKPKSE